MDQNETDALLGDSPDPGEGGASAGAGGPQDEAGGADTGELTQADIDPAIVGEETAGAGNAPGADAAPVGLDSEGRPLDELGAAMAAAVAEEKAVAEAARDTRSSPADLPIEEVQVPTFDREELTSEANQPISLLHDVELHVKIELGRTHMFVEDVLRLGEGSVVELDRLAGDPVDVYVNSRLVARGEVLVLNDNFCVRVSEIVSNNDARLAG